jgi:hypothetical protein
MTTRKIGAIDWSSCHAWRKPCEMQVVGNREENRPARSHQGKVWELQEDSKYNVQ